MCLPWYNLGCGLKGQWLGKARSKEEYSNRKVWKVEGGKTKAVVLNRIEEQERRVSRPMPLCNACKVDRGLCCVLEETASMGETIDDHDGFVIWMVDVRCFDDEMRSGRDADMMCSAGQTGIPAVWPARVELWLLFDDASLALVLCSLACATGCDLACLHKLANV